MFIRIRTFKNRKYKYLQGSYREGKKVKTWSVYLGPVQFEHGGSHLVRMVEESKQRPVEQPSLPQGLRVGPDSPVPQEKTPANETGVHDTGGREAGQATESGDGDR